MLLRALDGSPGPGLLTRLFPITSCHFCILKPDEWTFCRRHGACVLCLVPCFRYYSIFTLGMLVMFECTVVMQRQKNLRELRALQTPKQRLHVYRGGKWEVCDCLLYLWAGIAAFLGY